MNIKEIIEYILLFIICLSPLIGFCFLVFYDYKRDKKANQEIKKIK
jgi:hypothetical protein